jgi:ATP-dependent Clp protease ATP-binding subunit ClpX
MPPKEDASTRKPKFVEVNTQISCLLLVALLMVSKESFQKIEPSGSRYSTSKNTDNIDKDLLQYIIPKDIKDFGLILRLLVVYQY